MSRSNTMRALHAGDTANLAGYGRVRLPLIGSGLRASDSSLLVLPSDSFVEVPLLNFGADRRFSYPRSFMRLFDRAPVSKLAVEAESAGDGRRAESLFRLAFARGEGAPATVDAVESMTDRLLGAGLRVFLHEMLEGHDGVETSELKDRASVDSFLQNRVYGRITLMDVADVLDIFSPLFPLRGIVLNYDGRQDIGPNEFTAEGIYEGVGDDDLIFYVTFDTEGGSGRILFASIDVGDFTRMGFGTRSLLSRALFLKRHGVPGWNDIINNDGLAVWPRLGGVVDDESIHLAAAMLEELSFLGAARGFKDLDDGMPLEDLVGLKLEEEDIIDCAALMEWFTDFAEIPDRDLQMLAPPYEVGVMALESTTVSAYFDVETVLDNALHRYLPSRLAKIDGKRKMDAREAMRLIGDIGLMAAYEKARRENDVIDSASQAIAQASMAAPLESSPFGGALVAVGRGGSPDSSPIHIPASDLIVPDIYSPNFPYASDHFAFQNLSLTAAMLAGVNIGPVPVIR